MTRILVVVAAALLCGCGQAGIVRAYNDGLERGRKEQFEQCVEDYDKLFEQVNRALIAGREWRAVAEVCKEREENRK